MTPNPNNILSNNISDLMSHKNLIKKYFEQKELFEDFADLVGTASQLNREIYLNGVDDTASNNIEALIRFWNMYDDQLHLPVGERQPIKIFIDSWGGEMVAAFTLIDAIELSKTPVITINIGAAYSAGFFIFIAGHIRLAYAHSSFLYHEGSCQMGGDAHKFRNQADFYKKQLEQLKQHTLKHTKLTEEEYEKILKDDYWLTAEEAIEKGIADEICMRGL